jgi:ankyrin repeat protein
MGRIHEAARAGRAHEVRALLESGTPVNQWDGLRASPLHVAARAGRVECARVLLEADASPCSKDAVGRTPLHEAVRSLECVQLLLCHGARADDADIMGGTALLRAAESELSLPVIQALLAASANPNAQKNDGVTALHIASFESCLAVVRALLLAGADPSTTVSYCNATPLTWARTPDVAAALLLAGASPTKAIAAWRDTLDRAAALRAKALSAATRDAVRLKLGAGVAADEAIERVAGPDAILVPELRTWARARAAADAETRAAAASLDRALADYIEPVAKGLFEARGRQNLPVACALMAAHLARREAHLRSARTWNAAEKRAVKDFA